AGQEAPSLRLSVVARGVLRQRLRGVMLRVDRKRHQLHCRHAARRLLHPSHQRTHARARSGAGSENEIGHPNLSVEGALVERLTGFVSELKGGDLSVDGQGRLFTNASGQNQQNENAKKLHAELRVSLRFASAADAASMATPNATVTSKLVD